MQFYFHCSREKNINKELSSSSAAMPIYSLRNDYGCISLVYKFVLLPDSAKPYYA